MKSTRLKLISAFVLVEFLQGCASSYLDRKVHYEDHIHVTESPALVVPEPLKLTVTSNQFRLPSLEVQEESIGKALDIRPPIVLIVSANSTYPLQEDELIGVSVGATEFENNVQKELKTLLQSTFSSHGLPLEKVSKNHFRTPVLTKKALVKMGILGEKEPFYFEQTFEFMIEPQEQDIVRFLIAEQSFKVYESSPYVVTQKERHDNTLRVMNFVLEALRVERAEAAKQFKVASTFEQTMEVTFGAQSDTNPQLGWHITLPKYHLWTSLPLALKTIGWLVSDLDRDAGIYYMRLQDLKAFGALKNTPEVEAFQTKMLLMHLEPTESGFSFIYLTNYQGVPVSEAISKQLEPAITQMINNGGF
jgi:outer membrane protein assembly factor BamC